MTIRHYTQMMSKSNTKNKKQRKDNVASVGKGQRRDLLRSSVRAAIIEHIREQEIVRLAFYS